MRGEETGVKEMGGKAMERRHQEHNIARRREGKVT